MIRIGVDARELKKDRSTGIKRYLTNLLSTVLEIGDDLSFVLFSDSEIDFPIDTRAIIHLRTDLPTIVFDQVFLPKVIGEYKIDVFFSPYLKAPLANSCPTVITIHDLLFLRDYRRYLGAEGFFHNLWNYGLGRLLAHQVSRILTVSNFSGREIVSLLGCAKDKVKVLYPGVDPVFQRREDRRTADAFLADHRLDEGYVLYLGNLKPHKNVPALIRCHRALADGLRQKHPLVIAGDDPKSLPLINGDDKIRFVGRVADEHLPSLYRGASLFVTLSRFEGFGFPVIEAFSCGVAVLCSATTSLGEIAANAARLVHPDDDSAIVEALVGLLSSPEERSVLQKKGSKRVVDFDWQKTARGFIDLIRSVHGEFRKNEG